MSAVFASLLPVFMLIVAGAALRRVLVREDAHWIGVERLVYYVLFPALLVDTLARADLGAVPFAGVGGALAGAVLVMSAVCLALRPFLTTRLRVDGPAFTSFFQGATRWQTFVVLAIAGNLFGDRGLTLAAVGVVAMIPLINVINVWVLARFAAPDPPEWRYVLLAIVQNPLIWGCIIGGALNILGPPVPQPVYAFLDLLGRSSLALGLLAVGSGLKPGDMLRPRTVTILATTLKLAVMPTFAIALGLLLGLHDTNLAVVACCASVPSASNAYVLARQMGGDAPLMAQILTMETLLAIITMPIAITLATRL
jgi:malonate transporter and related proteins